MTTTIETLKAQAAKYERFAQAEAAAGAKYGYDATPAVTGFRTLVAMFIEAIAKGQTMTEAQFEAYAQRCIAAAWQWEATVGPDAYTGPTWEKP